MSQSSAALPNSDPPALVGFSAGRSAFARIIGAGIRLFTGGDVNHAFLLTWSAEWGCWLAVGANANGLVPAAVSVFEEKRIIKHVFAPVGFSLWAGLRRHVTDIDAGYDYVGMLSQAFIQIARRLTLNPHYDYLVAVHRLFCSRWVAEVVHDAIIESSSPYPVSLRDRWPLIDVSTTVIDPAQLCRAMIAAPGLWHELAPDLVHSTVLPL